MLDGRGHGFAVSWRRRSASGAVVFATLAASFALMYAVKATGTLRVSREGELEGLDLHEHGMVAYPEYVIHGYEPGPTSDARGTTGPVPVKAFAESTAGEA
jgi:Amt family ammonium transporter